MIAHVCPWWSAWFTISNPLRRLVHSPERILRPYVTAGMTVLDVGCGVGWFTISMAEMVGDRGRVIAIDLQRQMLDALRRRAEKAGVADRIESHKCEPDRLAVNVQADFALAFAMVHEVPDQGRLLGEIHACLKPGGKLLFTEPPLHVSGEAFQQSVATAERVGFREVEKPRIPWCRSVAFAKE